MNFAHERLNKENKKNIGIEPVVDMKHFVMLLLVDMARKSPITYFDGRKTKTACLETDYKRIIEEIMYEGHGWGIKFAEFIDIANYYEYQIEWEEKLAKTIKEVCDELGKELRLDIEYEYIEIDFTKEEIENIRSHYDQHILETMDHFSNLMYSPVFRRKFKMETREMNRKSARWDSEMEDLKLRTKYKNNLTIAKPLYEQKTEIKKENKLSIKKIGEWVSGK